MSYDGFCGQVFEFFARRISMNGQLCERPLVEILHEIAASQFSGAVRLMRERVKAIVYLEGGKFLFATTNLRAHRLAEIARRRGILSGEQIKNLELKTRKRMIQTSDEEFAALLVADFNINQEQVTALRAEQTIDALRVLLLWTDGEWNFTKLNSVVGVLGDLPRLFIEPTPLLIEAARHLPAEFAAKQLSNDEELIAPAAHNSSFTSHSSFDKEMQNLASQISTNEAYMLSRLDQPMSVGTLVMLSGLPDAHARQIIYALTLSGNITREARTHVFTDAAANATHAVNHAKRSPVPAQISSFFKPGAAQAKFSAAPPTVKNEAIESPDPQAELDELFRRATGATHYEVLRIQNDVPTGDLKRIYHALAKRFHPDRFRRESDRAIRSRIEQSFARISQAYDTLRDEKTRATYDLKLKVQQQRAANAPNSPVAASKPNTPHPSNPNYHAPLTIPQVNFDVPPIEQAEERFKQGLNALKSGNNVLAAMVFGEAVKLAPNNARYHALYGNALTCEPRTHRQAEAELQKAIALDTKEISYRIMLAEFYKQIGLRLRAIGELERSLTVDANHAGARRLLDEIKGTKNSDK
ncbi:MAG: hypothetical protein NVSMB56_12960 [Pyrinomonadaceae bacterium]